MILEDFIRCSLVTQKSGLTPVEGKNGKTMLEEDVRFSIGNPKIRIGTRGMRKRECYEKTLLGVC